MLAHSAAAKPRQGRPGPSATPARVAAPQSLHATTSHAAACCIVLQRAAKPARKPSHLAANPATKCSARRAARTAPDTDCQLHVLPLARRAAPLAHALRLARRHLRGRTRPHTRPMSDNRCSNHLRCRLAAAAPGRQITPLKKGENAIEGRQQTRQADAASTNKVKHQLRAGRQALATAERSRERASCQSSSQLSAAGSKGRHTCTHLPSYQTSQKSHAIQNSPVLRARTAGTSVNCISVNSI